MRLLQHALERVVVDVSYVQPGREPGSPQRLGRPHIPDAGDQVLPLKRLGQRQVRHSSQPSNGRVGLGSACQDVRPQPTGDVVRQLEDGPVPLNGLELPPAQNEPRLPSHRSAARLHPPAAIHAKVTTECRSAFEAEKKVLPNRLDSFESQPVEAWSQSQHCPARMRRIHFESLADERLEPAGGAVDAVALGHCCPG